MAMTWRQITKLVIGIVTAIVIVYDVIVYASAGGDATVSRVILDWSRRYPPLTLAFGFLLGHLFWAQTIDRDRR